MNLDTTVDRALKAAQRAKDYTDILNVFSAHLYCRRTQNQAYEIQNFWAGARDDLVFGDAMGREAVKKAYYSTLGGTGSLYAKASSSPYIVIAEDGMSAHGVWFVPGFCCERGPDGMVTGNYVQGKNAVDFVKEADGWKILRLKILPDFRTPCTDIRFQPETYDFCYPAGTCEKAYSADAPADRGPALPTPYQTWNDA